MKVPKWLSLLSLVVGLVATVFVLATPGTVRAATYPGIFYGTAQVDGVAVDAETAISAWVASEEVASTTTGEGSLDSDAFALTVELAAPAEVSFKIGELLANETATWVQYGAVEIDLTASTSTALLVSIAVTPATASIVEGETQQFVATGTYDDDSTADVHADAVWTSSDEAVATVVVGVATGLAAGTSTITATVDSISGSASLEVTPVLTGIAVTPATASIQVGATQQFTATGSYSDDSTADVTADAVWTSSDELVASVSAGGLATGLALGTASITATLGGFSDSATLSVVVAPTTVELVEGVNVIPYTGATTSLPGALTNIGPDGSGAVEIIWARAAWTDGVWLFYNPVIGFGTLSQLENEKAYIIVVGQASTWELP